MCRSPAPFEVAYLCLDDLCDAPYFVYAQSGPQSIPAGPLHMRDLCLACSKATIHATGMLTGCDEQQGLGGVHVPSEESRCSRSNRGNYLKTEWKGLSLSCRHEHREHPDDPAFLVREHRHAYCKQVNPLLQVHSFMCSATPGHKQHAASSGCSTMPPCPIGRKKRHPTWS